MYIDTIRMVLVKYSRSTLFLYFMKTSIQYFFFKKVSNILEVTLSAEFGIQHLHAMSIATELYS